MSLELARAGVGLTWSRLASRSRWAPTAGEEGLTLTHHKHLNSGWKSILKTLAKTHRDRLDIN